jgi:hypothetical protein
MFMECFHLKSDMGLLNFFQAFFFENSKWRSYSNDDNDDIFQKIQDFTIAKSQNDISKKNQTE